MSDQVTVAHGGPGEGGVLHDRDLAGELRDRFVAQRAIVADHVSTHEPVHPLAAR